MKILRDILTDECGVVDIERLGSHATDRETALGTEVSGICSDSRKVTPGCAFIAVHGAACDGHDFIGKAAGAGAAVIVYDDRTAAEKSLAEAGVFSGDIVLVQVKSTRHALGFIASAWFDNPSHRLRLVGITGTNGKTTTVTLLYRLFTSLGYSCGLLSTIANYVAGKRSETANTTSDPITINSLLNEMCGCGCEFCFMEVSSIGLEQERVAGLEFCAGIFSNLTHDHLDYHKTFA